LNHTARRILESMSITCNNNTVLHCKWGFDGTLGFSEYKQISISGSKDDSLFVTSIVPIRLVNQSTNDIIWQNPTCSSVRYCRPIRLQYVKESTEVSQDEEKYISEQIKNLSSYISDFGTVYFNLELTMIDGKVLKKYCFVFICNITSII